MEDSCGGANVLAVELCTIDEKWFFGSLDGRGVEKDLWQGYQVGLIGDKLSENVVDFFTGRFSAQSAWWKR